MTFLVTIAPAIVTYSDTDTFGTQTFHVHASSKSEAVKRARRQRMDEDGPSRVPARITAVAITDDAFEDVLTW